MQTTFLAEIPKFQYVPFVISFHCVTVPAKFILFNVLQLRNAITPMKVTESGMVTLVKLLQPSNAISPIEVTESGMVTLVNLLQL